MKHSKVFVFIFWNQIEEDETLEKLTIGAGIVIHFRFSLCSINHNEKKNNDKYSLLYRIFIKIIKE